MNIFVVAAYPDDEILGCGGTMALHSARGDKVTVLIMAEGITSRLQVRDVVSCRENLTKLQQTAIEANKVVGVSDVRFAGLPDNRMDSVDLLDVVKIIEKVMDDIQPEIIYTHHHADLNIDHQITHQAVMTAARPLPNSPIKEVLFFEVPSATGWNTPISGNAFIPQYYVDISQNINDFYTALDLKIKALEVYSNEMRSYPHARSIESIKALADFRGSSVGFLHSESFQVGRILI
ncbi:PIG-L family deacetylase [Thermosynechococcus sichuanensis E542]|uniref:PIG-L family deacetylase n=1 Tax=Thermosynechococcus sichuanensis E542 TaxID=2016101 RepID=A0A3B7MD01_9CYAN|nr:PIG-L family deacetylase [Thermosynechococcus vestitus]AXY67722.1 PIG-L family deacetylase [Thermosynechococcus vestitus E542]